MEDRGRAERSRAEQREEKREKRRAQWMPRPGRGRGIVVGILYPLIDLLFSYKYAQRIKIAMNVLGSDWRMSSPYTFFPDPMGHKYSHDEFMDIFKDTDTHSLDLAEKFYECSMKMPQIPPKYERMFFYNFSYFKASWKKSTNVKRQIRKDIAAFQKKYGFYCGSEVSHYHHGLRLLDKSLLNYISGRAFIDVGACQGDSSIIFKNYSPSKIYAFEPSRKNRDAYEKNVTHAGISKDTYELVPFGLGDAEKEIRFNDIGTGSNVLDDSGDNVCKIITLDSFCKNTVIDVGLVKIDLEGMGEQMIRGSLETIEKYRPVLCLALYHHAGELCETTKLLRERLKNYRFELRELSDHDLCCEMTLIAWPEEIFNGDCAKECKC